MFPTPQGPPIVFWPPAPVHPWPEWFTPEWWKLFSQPLFLGPTAPATPPAADPVALEAVSEAMGSEVDETMCSEVDADTESYTDDDVPPDPSAACRETTKKLSSA